jgi:type I protein arginine methyltransferase
MFSLADFGKMIGDRPRLDAHAEALRRVVTPSSIVIDIGAGTGIMSLLACRAGARRVYAIEPSEVVHLLADAARDNGFADRVVIVQQRSTAVTLPERADVIVSDLRGVLPAFGTHFADLVDARTRFLAPAGRLLPATDTLWAAVVSAPEAFDDRRRVWQSHPYGLDLRAAQRVADNLMEKHRARPDQLLSDPVRWATLDYPVLTDLSVRGAGTCGVTKDGVAHGLLVWFDTALVGGVGYSNAPGAREGVYGQMLFPWPEEVALRIGDQVGFELRADPIGADYLWTWTTQIPAAIGDSTGLRRFRQSTFKGLTPSSESLRRRAASFAPALSAGGLEVLEVLEGMRAGETIGVIAAGLVAAHPGRFRSLDHAQGWVAELVQRYGA